MIKYFFLFFSLLLMVRAQAQDKWSLERCVTYAVENNISVKQADVQQRLAGLNLKAARAGQLPNANFSTNGGYNFGRSVNPATNAFESQRIFFSGFQLQGGVTLFNWFAQKHNVEANRLQSEASRAAFDKARNDIALNVAVAYLQALLASEQAEISAVQVQQSQAQLQNIQKQVAAGTLPELNAAELEAQLARDSASFISARAVYQQNVIQLKALLNLDMAAPFDIEKPDVRTIPVESLGELQPQPVFEEALKNLPQQRVNQFRFLSAQKSIQAARSAMFPTLSAFANIGSNYSSLFPDQQNMTVTPTGKYDTLGFVEVSPGNLLPAVRPGFAVSVPNTPFGRQWFDINLSQAVGVSLSIPIFNRRQLRTNWERSKLDAENIQLQMNSDNLRLQQDIFLAYNDAVNAMQRYSASQKAVQATEKAFNFSQKRYDIGLLQTIELITNQNNLFRARLDAVAAQYEYVFRVKLLEFYKGKGIKL